MEVALWPLLSFQWWSNEAIELAVEAAALAALSAHQEALQRSLALPPTVPSQVCKRTISGGCTPSSGQHLVLWPPLGTALLSECKRRQGEGRGGRPAWPCLPALPCVARCFFAR